MKSVKDINDHDLLEYIQAWNKNGMEGANPVDMFVEKGFPSKVVYAKLEKLAGRGLIDYGVSVRYCWLTPEGEQRLSDDKEISK